MYGLKSTVYTPPPRKKHNYLYDPPPPPHEIFLDPCIYVHEYHNTVHVIKISKSKRMGHIACFYKV